MSIKNERLIAVAISKSIVREYTSNSNDRIVYLNDGDEFQIQLFNPYSYTIGAEIRINGKLLTGLLVIRPGERIWLERPMTGDNRKFKFETYEVEDGNSAVEKAIQNNGWIEVKFYKEREKQYYSFEPITFTSTCSDPLYNGYGTTICSGSVDYCPNGNTVETVLTSVCNATDNYAKDNTATYNSNTLKTATGTLRCKAIMNSNEDLKTNISGAVNCITADDYLNFTPIAATVKGVEFEQPKCTTSTKETGRIGSGQVSNQNFNHIDKDFEYWTITTEKIHILPMSQKPFTNSDIQRRYCTSCGRKINPKFKYCPYCGEKCIQYEFE